MSHKVLVLIDRHGGFWNHCLLGITDFMHQTPSWRCSFGYPSPDAAAELVSRADGVVAYCWEQGLLNRLTESRKPFVDVASRFEVPAVPRVGCDWNATGRMAADYFADRGYQQMAYFGPLHWPFASASLAGFQSTAARNGRTVLVAPWAKIATVDRGVWLSVNPGTREWLRNLPKPVAVFCATDHNAAEVTMACEQESIRVPEDVAVLGVENDEFFCRAAVPPISSIEIPIRRIGYEAARLLHGLMAGDPFPSRPLLLPPSGIIDRRSTEALALNDPDLVAAVRLLRASVDKPVHLGKLLSQVPAGRRTLELRFRQVLGRSPHEELRRLRLARAKDLLRNTDLEIPEVARRSGFVSGVRLAIAFRRFVGCTPTEYRRPSLLSGGACRRI